MSDKELEIAIDAFWEAPGSTVAGIRAAIDAVDRHRDGWSKTLSERDERSETEATQAVAVGVSGDLHPGKRFAVYGTGPSFKVGPPAIEEVWM